MGVDCDRAYINDISESLRPKLWLLPVWVRLNIIKAQPTVAWLIRGPVDGPRMTANYTAARSAPSHPAHFHRAP